MNDIHKYNKLPRLYISARLNKGELIELSAAQAHYLHNVLRRENGQLLRLFNGMDGEWLCELKSANRKQGRAIPLELKREQSEPKRRVYLLFTPIKKQRMDFLVEKAVELGVTDLFPILTQNTEVRRINRERIQHQVIEAAEQCERLDVPDLHDPGDFRTKLAEFPEQVKVMACIERFECATVFGAETQEDIAILIGPEGGFTEEERQWLLSLPSIKPVSLGDNILRSETAALAALSVVSFRL